MPKSTKKKPRSKAVAAALKVMENMVFETTDLDVQLKQVKEKLNTAGFSLAIGSIAMAGRYPGGGLVQINVGSSIGHSTVWPEWAYGIAERALYFNKRVFVVYNNVLTGANLLAVYCLS